MHRSPHSKVDAISPLSSYRGVIMSKMWSILYKGELGLIRYSDCIDFRMPTASHETDQTSRITLPHALSYAYYMLHMTRITSYHFISLHITSTNKAAIESRHRWRQSRGRAGVPCVTQGTQVTGVRVRVRVRGRSSSIKHRLSRLAYGRLKTVM